jgi:hypothetical protein
MGDLTPQIIDLLRFQLYICPWWDIFEYCGIVPILESSLFVCWPSYGEPYNRKT